VDGIPDDRGTPPAPRASRTPQPVPDLPPTLPSRTAFALAFTGIVVAGLFGAVIGYGLGDLSAGDGLAPLVWAVVGAVVAAGGVGIVAVLVLRAQAEWRQVPPGAAPPPVAPVDPAPVGPDDGDRPDDPDDADGPRSAARDPDAAP
jgi:hypothetical protein